ncbi:MFS transporter [Streptomyces sp. NPDC005356]|uniref:MFS transporter n=1 Tax=Streptomyces sp. NPDC005356 TaxID=3157167 RepID=UPI0033B17139
MNSPSPTTPLERPRLPKLAAATSIGTAIEYYDFTAYAIATGLVFNEVFFPEVDSLVGTLLSFVVFFTGFLARPIGGIIAGHFGDRIGRKRMLVATVLTMGIATVLIGTLPTYSQIGMFAPLALLVLRLLQGFAAGGEWGGSALVATEHAPPGRRGLYGSWSMVGISAGGLLSSSAFALLALLDKHAFVQWGWRVPFLASAILVAVGFWVRVSVSEPESFRAARDTDSVVRLPVVELLRTAWRTVLLATGISVGYNAFVYLVFTFSLSYATGELGLPRQLILNALIVGLALQIPAILLAAVASDRWSRFGVMITGGVLMAVDAFFFFVLLDTRNTLAVYLAITVAYLCTALMYGPLAAAFSESFDLRVRYSGISLSYQLGASLGGGLTPTVLTLLLLTTGSAFAAASYISALSLLAVGCAIGLDRAARQRTTSVDVATDEAAPLHGSRV